MCETFISVFVISTSLLLFETFGTLLNPDFYHFHVRRLEHCDEEERWNISLRFVNFKVVKQDGFNAKFSGMMEIVKPIQINFRLSVHGLLCDGPQDRACSHKFIRQFGYICQKLKSPNSPWYDFIKDKYVCPIPTGYYDMGAMTININSLISLPLGAGYWIIKVIGYQGKEVIMCVYSELEITSTKSRSKINGGKKKMNSNVTQH